MKLRFKLDELVWILDATKMQLRCNLDTLRCNLDELTCNLDELGCNLDKVRCNLDEQLECTDINWDWHWQHKKYKQLPPALLAGIWLDIGFWNIHLFLSAICWAPGFLLNETFVHCLKKHALD